jgi:prophage DNA circulation protein
MSLSDDLRPASFRGVPFGVLDASDGRGRNTVIHEFPLRDKVYVEDLGRAQRTVRLTAFVVGPDYAARRDALTAALEEEGPGTLVHPWLGSLTVSLVSPAEIKHSAADGGLVTFSLQFTESDPPESPGFSLSWPDITSARGLAARAAAGAALAAEFLLRPVAEEALTAAHEWAQGLAGIMEPVYQTVVKFPFVAGTVSVFFAQAERGGSLASVVQDFWPVRNYSQDIGAEAAFRESAGLLKLSLATVPPPVSSLLGRVRRETARNARAVMVYQRELAGIAGLEAAAYAEPASGTEARKLRTLAREAEDRILENASSDEVFRSVRKLGVSAQRALAEAARKAPEIVGIEARQVESGLTLAWREVLTGLGRGRPSAVLNDLIKRNGIRHPGFVPAGELEALLGQHVN